jgi:hypothetical protein
MEFQAITSDTPKSSYIFDIGKKKVGYVILFNVFPAEDPINPLVELQPPNHLVCSQFNPRDSHILAAGCHNGQVHIN